MQVVLATSNPGKLHEARAILEASGITIATAPMWLGEVETADTYLENARLKALAAMRMVRRPVIAEDAGLEVDALKGLPGPRSARFAGPAATALENNEKLLRLLDGVPGDRRTARFRAIAVLLMPTGEEVVGEGVLEGRIAKEPRGNAGFGYDPLFIPDGEMRSVAQIDDEEKNAISHRGGALREIVSRLDKAK